MKDAGGNACQARQRTGIIQIAQQRCDIALAQHADTLGRGSQRKDPQATTEPFHDTHANVATADDQQALTAKTGGQCAQRGLV